MALVGIPLILFGLWFGGTKAKDGSVQPTHWNFNSRDVNNDQSHLSGDASFSDNTQGTVQLVLDKSGNDWKVSGFSLSQKWMDMMTDNLDTIVASLRQIQTEGSDIPSNAAIFTADQDKNYYIQFSAGHDNTPEPRDGTYLYAEAVSNDYLERKFALTHEQISRLQSLGWKLPDASPNYWRTYRAVDDGDRQEIAQEIMRAFVEVYGASPNQLITVELQIE